MADMYVGRRERLETEDHRRSDRDGGGKPQAEAGQGPREPRSAHPHDSEDCENLLENFFMQVKKTGVSYAHIYYLCIIQY